MACLNLIHKKIKCGKNNMENKKDSEVFHDRTQ